MRIVLLPTISISDYKKDSDFYWFKKFADICVKNNCYVYFVLPKKFINQIEDEPQIKYIFTDDVEGFFAQLQYFPYELTHLFSHLNGKYFVDCVITSRNIASIPISNSLSGRSFNTMPVFLFENIVRKDFFNDLAFKQLALTYSNIPTWYCSHNEYQQAREIAAKNNVNYVNSKDIIKWCGINVSVLKDYFTSKDDSFTVFFGGRINNGDKNFNTLAEVIEKLYAMNSKIKFVITSVHDSRGVIDKYRDRLFFAEFHINTPRELFYKLASKSHVFACTSKRESYTIGFTEQVYLAGHSVQILRDWNTSIYKKGVKFVKSKNEMIKYLYWLSKNYKEIEPTISEVRSYYETYHNEELNYLDVFNWIRSSVKDHYKRFNYNNIFDLEKTTAMMADEFDFKTWLKNLPDGIKSIATGGGTKGIQGYSAYFLYNFLIQNKLAVDDYKNPYPYLYRIK